MGRALALSKQYDLLIRLQIRPYPSLQILFALGWVGLFWGSAWMLSQKRPSTQRIIPVLITLYVLYDLGIRFLFAPSRNLPAWSITGLFFGLCVLFTYWALNRKAAKQYFRT